MPKAVITIPGVRYSTSFTQAGTVEAVLSSGTRVHLKAVNEAGQCSYTAISGRVEISDNAAVTVPETNHVVPAETGVDAEVVEQLVETSLTSWVEDTSTPTGTEDSHYYYADIPAKYLSAGTLHSIVLVGPDQLLNAYDQPAYLALRQETSPGTDNWQFVAVSTNAVAIEAAKQLEWFFDGAQLNGERLEFCLLNSPTYTKWNLQLNIRSRVSVTSQWQDGHIFQPTTATRLPELIIKMKLEGERFAPASHVGDVVLHLTAEEHAGLTALLAHKDEILALFPAASTTELEEEAEPEAQPAMPDAPYPYVAANLETPAEV